MLSKIESIINLSPLLRTALVWIINLAVFERMF